MGCLTVCQMRILAIPRARDAYLKGRGKPRQHVAANADRLDGEITPFVRVCMPVVQFFAAIAVLDVPPASAAHGMVHVVSVAKGGDNKAIAARFRTWVCQFGAERPTVKLIVIPVDIAGFQLAQVNERWEKVNKADRVGRGGVSGEVACERRKHEQRNLRGPLPAG